MNTQFVDNENVRRQNLRALVRQAGSLQALSEQAHLSYGYLSQLHSGKNGKTMGHRTARRIEQALGLSNGWMDYQHDETMPEDVKEAYLDLASHQKAVVHALILSMGVAQQAPPEMPQ